MAITYGQIVCPPKVATQCAELYKPESVVTVAAGAASAATAAVLGCQAIEMVSTQPAYIHFAASPTATSSTGYIPAGVPVRYMVDPAWKVAALKAGATDGVVFITKFEEVGESY